MPIRLVNQPSFLDLQAEEVIDLEPGSLVWLLARYRAVLFPRWLTAGWGRGSGPRGRNAYPVEALLCLWLLRWDGAGMSRLGACKHACVDISWQRAMGLPVGSKMPTEKTMREFEGFLREEHEETGLPRYMVVHEHVVNLVLWLQEHDRAPPAWVIDSTPMWCYGAVLDTVRLLGDGLRRLGRRYARAAGVGLGALAKKLDLDLLLAKSTKGHFHIDWHDVDQRSELISTLVQDVLRIVEWVRDHLEPVKGPARAALVGQCDVLLRVIEQDLEQDKRGRWRITRGVARDRLVSVTEPEARHGHKSRSESHWGYKLNVLGDAQSGLIAAVSVTPGNGHDAEPGHVLVARVQKMRIELRQLLADTAYGGTEHRIRMRSIGVDLVAPPPPVPEPREKQLFGRSAFDVDMAKRVARCPNGVETTEVSVTQTQRLPAPLAFRWPVEVCGNCPLREKCMRNPPPRESVPVPTTERRTGRPRTGRRLVLHPFEAELIAARKAWEDPALRELYRQRSTGERLHVLLLQHGARHARAYGRAAAEQQAHAIAIRTNLGLLARGLAAAIEASMATSARRAA